MPRVSPESGRRRTHQQRHPPLHGPLALTHLENLEGGERGGAQQRSPDSQSHLFFSHSASTFPTVVFFSSKQSPDQGGVRAGSGRDQERIRADRGGVWAGSREDLGGVWVYLGGIRRGTGWDQGGVRAPSKTPPSNTVFPGLSKHMWEPVGAKDKHFTHSAPSQRAVEPDTVNTPLPVCLCRVKGQLTDTQRPCPGARRDDVLSRSDHDPPSDV